MPGHAEGAVTAGHDRVRPVAHRDLHLVADNTCPAPAAALAPHIEAAPAAHSAHPSHPIEEDTFMVSAAPSEGPPPETVMTGTDGALQHPVQVTRLETISPLPHVAASETAEPATDASLEITPDVSAVPPFAHGVRWLPTSNGRPGHFCTACCVMPRIVCGLSRLKSRSVYKAALIHAVWRGFRPC